MQDSKKSWGDTIYEFLSSRDDFLNPRNRKIVKAMLIALLAVIVIGILAALTSGLSLAAIFVIGALVATYVVLCTKLALEEIFPFPPNVVAPPAQERGALQRVAGNAMGFASAGVRTVKGKLHVAGDAAALAMNPKGTLIGRIKQFLNKALERLKTILTAVGIVVGLAFLLTIIGFIPGGLLGFAIVAIPIAILTVLAGIQVTGRLSRQQEADPNAKNANIFKRIFNIGNVILTIEQPPAAVAVAPENAHPPVVAPSKVVSGVVEVVYRAFNFLGIGGTQQPQNTTTTPEYDFSGKP